MTHLLHQSSAPARRVAVVALIATLLGIAASMALSADSASAAGSKCKLGDFCLTRDFGGHGGLYHFNRSDPNLHNDRFEGEDIFTTVGDNTVWVWNNGVANGRLVDVVAYVDTGYSGRGLCIRRGRSADLHHVGIGHIELGFFHVISSFKWVTPEACSRYPQVP
jgi:hypothetical protein